MRTMHSCTVTVTQNINDYIVFFYIAMFFEIVLVLISLRFTISKCFNI